MSWEAVNTMFCFILRFRINRSSEVKLFAMEKGYFFFLHIIGLIITFKVNWHGLGNPYLHTSANSGHLLRRRQSLSNGNAPREGAISRVVPVGVASAQSHWRLEIMTWKRETPLSEWSRQMLIYPELSISIPIKKEWERKKRHNLSQNGETVRFHPAVPQLGHLG